MLTERQRRLYARQVILRELGPAGQARLCASTVTADAGSDPCVLEVALDYLHRSGVQVVEAGAPAAHGAGPSQHVEVATTAQVRYAAAGPELQACAEWLLGAWAAVETIKKAAQLGTPAPRPPQRPWHRDVDGQGASAPEPARAPEND